MNAVRRLIEDRAVPRRIDATAEAVDSSSTRTFRLREESTASAVASKIAILILALLVTTAHAQDTKGPYDAAIAKIQERSEALDRKNANVADIKVWPGVLADRRSQTVTIFGCATGIKHTDPLEFFVTPITSGRDYEALAVTPAKPSNVVAALQFIGLKPGMPIDPDKDRFWARGTRLTTQFIIAGKTRVSGDAVMIDASTAQPIPGDLLFAGSYSVTDANGVSHLAADDGDAKSLAPTYEDPAAVLAVPRRAPQSAVYGSQKPAPDGGVDPRRFCRRCALAGNGERTRESPGA